MKKQNYTVDILVNGKPIKEYIQKNNTYIEGRKDVQFSIRIKNNGYKRIVAIPSVDGLSVLNGKKASHYSSGYIIEGHSSLTVDGWRVSDQEVRQFYFTDPDDSYANKTKNGDNLGVIGVAVYREKDKPQITYTYPTMDIEGSGGTKMPRPPIFFNGTSMDNAELSCSSNNVLRDAGFSPQSAELGTGWGESKKSEVITEEFEREDVCDAEFVIYYNTRRALEKQGIDFSKKVQYVAPQAFPGQYCEPPRD